MPEGIEFMEKNLDRHNFGHGPVRLREMKMYDLQFPVKDREKVINDFYFTLGERIHKSGLAYQIHHKEAPFKHGKLKRLINLAVKLFGWPLGLKPVEPWKEIKKSAPHQVQKPLMNVYPLAEIPDTFITNKATGKTEEYQ